MSQIVQIVIDQMNTQLNRIEVCFNRLSEEDVWHKLSPNTNSIANLCIHLAGNEYQHFVSGFGKKPFIRERSQEFEMEGGLSKEVLLEQLTSVRKESIHILNRITDQDLERQVKIYFETEDWKRMKEGNNEIEEPYVSRSIQSHLIFVAEHYGFHCGQIVYITKLLEKNGGNIGEFTH